MLLTLVAVVATVWLASTGRLELYIHPRYTVFTIVMALVAGALALGALLLLPGREAHEDDDEAPRGPVARWAAVVTTGLVVVGAVAVLLVAPPGTLSTTGSRGQNTATLTAVPASSTTTELVGGDSTSFTVKDWWTLLRDGADTSDLARMPADVTGFVIATDEPDVYYLARYLITCCAVDALPVAVPVYAPGWQDSVAEGDWLELTGTFRSAPDAALSEPLVLMPDAVTPVDEPADPYVY